MDKNTMESDEFVSDIQATVRNYSLGSVGCMDETSVSVGTTVMTIALTCYADGSKGPMFVILKRGSGRAPALATVPAQIQVAGSTTGWMTERLMLEWLQTCWTDPEDQVRSVLVLDKLPSHTTAKVGSGTCICIAIFSLSCVCAYVSACVTGAAGCACGRHSPEVCPIGVHSTTAAPSLLDNQPIQSGTGPSLGPLAGGVNHWYGGAAGSAHNLAMGCGFLGSRALGRHRC
eukprot:GHVU01097431.1.p1 GENE.GHVU01097431.1~~GHVU01097431.1.p1  ORF type:complete len:231 (+),score=2.20 GHVU01097431.1:176-868(+)